MLSAKKSDILFLFWEFAACQIGMTKSITRKHFVLSVTKTRFICQYLAFIFFFMFFEEASNLLF